MSWPARPGLNLARSGATRPRPEVASGGGYAVAPGRGAARYYARVSGATARSG
jgi:hypothetical protein